jgi:ABC-type Fe3+/spermidine/putrescine transport system ATPase subunit
VDLQSHSLGLADLEPRTARRPLVRLRGVSKKYGAVQAVTPLDLDIMPGDFFAILGPSGCGKTTLLRMIGGFVALTSGTIEIDGVDLTGRSPEDRPTNMVFQGYGLFPHMNVRQNIAYGLRIARRPREEIEERVRQAIRLVQLDEHSERHIDQLSGGQQQRVALARALIMRPKVLLLDEPLAALDLQLRHTMREELRRIHHEIGGTFVFVTHDQGEALGLANRIAVMEAGRVVQEGNAREIYASPNTRFVSAFVGEANLLKGRREKGVVRLQVGPQFPDGGTDGEVSLAIRPENIDFVSPSRPSDIVLWGRVSDVIYLGAYVKYRIELPDRTSVVLNIGASDDRRHPTLGEEATVGWSFSRHRVLNE